MSKYNNIQELANGFKSGELSGWILRVDNDSTHLHWVGDLPTGVKECSDAAEDFCDKKYDEGNELWDSPDVYILDQALTAAGIPNEGV